MYATESASQRAEPTPWPARGSALRSARRLTSRADPLLGSLPNPDTFKSSTHQMLM